MMRSLKAVRISGLAACLVSWAFLAAPVLAKKDPIQHIVVVMQEDRSFDDLFCSYPGANGLCAKQAIGLAANCVIAHTFEDFERDRNTGDFSHEAAHCPGYHRPQYAYVPAAETKPYAALAKNYVLGDNMFSSTGNPSFEAHQYLIAAQADSAKDAPFGSAPSDGCVYQQLVKQFKGPAIPACFTYQTLGGELDANRLEWTYYAEGAPAGAWDAYGWISGFGSEYPSHVVKPPTQFLTDVANGKLAPVTWVTPEIADSDEPGSRSKSGPSWVASVVNAVGGSQYWNTSAIFITWSGFGGWYDHVPPRMLDFEGLGFRVPLLVVSPYAKQSSVSHVQYETASIDRFIEGTFGLPLLAAADARATDAGQGTLDFSRPPRPFVSIPTR